MIQAAFLFTVVGTTGFLGVLAGQLPGVTFIIFHFLCMYAHKLLYHLNSMIGRAYSCSIIVQYFIQAASFHSLTWKEMYLLLIHRKLKVYLSTRVYQHWILKYYDTHFLTSFLLNLHIISHLVSDCFTSYCFSLEE